MTFVEAHVHVPPGHSDSRRRGSAFTFPPDILHQSGGPVDGDVLAEVLSDTVQKRTKNTRPMSKGRMMANLPSKQRSQFGPQVDSNKRSSSAFGFGTATRFPGLEKKDQSAHKSQKPYKPYSVPGPGYYKSGSAIGLQEYSEKRSYPSFGFSKSKRFVETLREEQNLLGVPAPGTYALPPSCGIQPDSTKESLPCVSFGLASRDVKVSIGKGMEEDLKGAFTPGPDVYKPASGLGTQQLSSRSTASRFSFGSDMRATDPAKKNHEELRTAAIPGPGTYLLPKSMGNQHNSTKVSMPHYGFGTCYRDQAARASLGKLQAASQLGGYLSPGPASQGPGPSAYGPQPHSNKVTKPVISFGREQRFRAARAKSDVVPGPGSYCN